MKKSELGRYVAERRKSLRINQRELADLCGVSEHALVNLERGMGNPTFDLLDKVCETLGLEINLAPRIFGGLMRTVVVHDGDRDAGVLGKFRDGSYEFRYTDRFRRDATAASVAFTLPKSRAVHRSPILFPFFYGLLAEGVQKRAQCRALRIDENDHFTRLAETCRKGVIGAVWVEPR